MRKIAIISMTIFCINLCTLWAYEYKYQENISFVSKDGTKLSANLFTPISGEQARKFPAIIFANSWGLDEYQYGVQAICFAEKGYIVFSYSSRGWGLSGGMVTVAGPRDMEDLSAGIDWLLANVPVDEKNIGIAGISYGAGISLLGLAHDQRIKTAVAMSGWGDLAASLYGNETPRLVWGLILLGGGYLTGNMDPIIATHYGNLVDHKNIPEALLWASHRSPIRFVHALNAKGAPIYISNNFQDEMFHPNSLMSLFSQLTVPKRLDLNLGVHASAELGGLIGTSNYVWRNVHDWFDFWLKGIDTGIMDRNAVSMEVKNVSTRQEFKNWPSEEIKTKSYYLGKREESPTGSLLNRAESTSASDKISSGILSGISTGIPVISAVFKAHTPIDIVTWLPGTDRKTSIVYQSSEVLSDLKIRGIPGITVWIEPSGTEVQLIFHLYDVNPWEEGTLITHVPVTLYGATPGKPVKISLELIATTYNLPKGHRIALGIDTYDANYASPTNKSFQVKFHYGPVCESKLTIPYVD